MHRIVLFSAIVFAVVALSASAQPNLPNPGLNLNKFDLGKRHLYLAGQRGAEWLQRANRSDGRFIYGYVPSLRTVLEGNDFFAQAGAAFALARASQCFKDERSAAIAQQALLTLLLDTVPDTTDANIRYTRLPSELLDRVGAAGLLVMAIHELGEPGKDMLEQSQALCRYLRRQQREDGAFTSTEKDRKDTRTAAVHAGAALYAIILSQKHLPEPWKSESLASGRRFYMAEWHKHKMTESLPWHVAAYTEAFLQTKDKAHADSVFEMCDWLCTLQFDRLNAPQPQWAGGFKCVENGKESVDAPDMESARFALCLVEGCRTARHMGDAARWQRYRSALELSLQFVTTHQYTDANTQHFAELYRPVLVGAFHPSHQDGNLRLDCTHSAVAALAHYVKHVMIFD